MTLLGWAQIALLLAIALALAVPCGRFMATLATGGRTFLHPVLGPLEALLYRIAGVDPERGQSWRAYALALLTFSAVGFASLYAILRLQGVLPFNPRGFGGLSPWLAFNTAVSFVTNTNWQAYSGESALSYFSQMAGLTFHNFVSAAAGIAVAFAITRAFAAGGLRDLGNFWVDLTRITLYLLLPVTFLGAFFLIWQGMPQTLGDYPTATTLEGAQQAIAVGPVAFQIVIKQLGTNGGGFFGVNSLHPFENPTWFTDAFEIICMLVIPFGLCITFGRLVGDARQGRVLLAVMALFVVAGTAAVYAAEAAGNPLHQALGVDPTMGNLEGKDVRIGLPLMALWTAATTGASCGAVNAMFDSYMPLGGVVPLFLIQLGEVLPGGVGSGLYGILVFALLAVFIAGLMVGRTPEYLGKKVQAREVKLAMLAVLVLPASILGFTAVAMVIPAATSSILNGGPHGLSEMLYAYTSGTGNNGSAFGGLTADTPWLDVTLGIAMVLGRFAYAVPVLAIAGSLAAKPRAPASAGTFPTHTPLFIGLLAGVLLIVGGLQFMPSLALGPLAEHFQLLVGKTY
ncbi:MAG TPA: potassium-transporting ATPase subunit KdpA [Crenalkalicoccus sp.]|nr:potassium-transporting ATPase subunit KdpA [Crenalkalicoccus sp.]